MKKTYIIPEMEVIKIASQTQMMAGSTVPVDPTPENPGNSDAPGLDDDFDW